MLFVRTKGRWRCQYEGWRRNSASVRIDNGEEPDHKIEQAAVDSRMKGGMSVCNASARLRTRRVDERLGSGSMLGLADRLSNNIRYNGFVYDDVGDRHQSTGRSQSRWQERINPDHLHPTLAAHGCVSWMGGGRGGQGGTQTSPSEATAGDPTRKRTDAVLSRCS